MKHYFFFIVAGFIISVYAANKAWGVWGAVSIGSFVATVACIAENTIEIIIDKLAPGSADQDMQE